MPEVWLVRQQQLSIYRFQNGGYVAVSQSQFLPGIQPQDLVARCLQIAYNRNTSAAIRELKQQLGMGK